MEENKQCKVFYIEIMFYTLFLFGISACVFLNGDDFMYGSFAKEGIVENVVSYYATGNGRFWVNCLDSVILLCDRYLFMLINPLMIILFIALLAKNIQWIKEKKSDYKKERVYIRYGMILFSCIDILCLKETVFWITGMMNYLLPATLFLYAFLKFQQLRSNTRVLIRTKFLFCLICLFAGSSVEQYALMYVGIMTLLLFVDLIKKKTISKILWIGYICAIFGLAALFLAPGNFARVEEQKELVPFIDNLWTLIYQNTMSSVAIPFMVILTLSAGFLLKKRIWRLFTLLIILFILAVNYISELQRAVFIVVIPLMIFIEVLVLLLNRKYPEKLEIFSLLIVGLGSQIMLLISAIWGFRCMFSMYMIYMLLILFIITLMKSENRGFVICSGILASISLHILVLFWLFAIILKGRFVRLEKSYLLISQVSTIVTLFILFSGYVANVTTHIANITQAQNGMEASMISLTELPNEMYSWSQFPMNDFHERYYKRYYQLSDSVEIFYIENKEGE